MTLLVASIAAADLGELQRRAELAWACGADAVEVRLDTLTGGVEALAAYLQANQERTWIITCRRAEEGGRFEGTVQDRVTRIVDAARGTSAYVDFELADWRRYPDARRDIGAITAGTAHGRGTKQQLCPPRLILSAHDVRGRPENLSALVDDIRGQRGVCCAKVAYLPGDASDSFAALDLLHRYGGLPATGAPGLVPGASARLPFSATHKAGRYRSGASGNTETALRGACGVTAIAMGADGLWTRILAKKLGGFASYCSIEPDSATAPGQMTLDEMVHGYRWPAIDHSTRVYGVIGDPVAHSKSPLVLNRWFAEAGINAVYVPLRVTGGREQLGRFLDGCLQRPWLDVGGFSVTTPHKASALHWGRRGVNPTAAWIGAANTLKFDSNGTIAHNTDCAAAVTSLTAAMGITKSGLMGLSVDLLGTGGAARAVVHGLQNAGCEVCVYGRTFDRALRVASKHGATAAKWEQRLHGQGDVLVNCTTVGMWPNVNASPMPAEALGRYKLVFDLIYRPLETRLLKDAVNRGVPRLNGLDMFIRQAAMQFELWTGRTPNVGSAMEAVRRQIQVEDGPP